MREFNIGFVIYPGITQLDFSGPFEVLSRLGTPPSIGVASAFAHAKTHVAAKTLQPVVSDRGLATLPDCTFRDCPALDLICVPGGAGVAEAIADDETVDFVRRESERATYVTSVCIGAFLLGAAGLLDGRRATTHWAHADLLPLVGARHEKARVVRDGNVVTAAGVSSGIDFALDLVAETPDGGFEGDPARDRVRPGAALRQRPSRQGARAGRRIDGPAQRGRPCRDPGGANPPLTSIADPAAPLRQETR